MTCRRDTLGWVLGMRTAKATGTEYWAAHGVRDVSPGGLRSGFLGRLQQGCSVSSTCYHTRHATLYLALHPVATLCSSLAQ